MSIKAIPTLVVLDASFVLRYVLHTQAPRPHAHGLKLLEGCELLVPALWSSEIANALIQAERRGAASPAKVGKALTVIMALNPMVDSKHIGVGRNLELARAYRLSSYDALYFELALRRKAALATYDLGMQAAAPVAGLRLYPDPARAAAP